MARGLLHCLQLVFVADEQNEHRDCYAAQKDEVEPPMEEAEVHLGA